MRLLKPALLLCCYLFSIAAYAQSAREQLKESIRETLEEKSFKPEGERRLHTSKTTASYDQRITGSGTGVMEGEVALAMHPKDSSKLVISFMRYDTANYPLFPIYYSSNSGQTWTQSTFNPLSVFTADYPSIAPTIGGDPALAWDKTGRLYFSWIYAGEKATHDSIYYFLFCAWSDNNGQTWATSPGAHQVGFGVKGKASSMLADYSDGLYDREWMAVDNSTGTNAGRVYLSFLLQPPVTKMPLFGISVRSKTASGNFGAITNALPLNMQFSNIAVDSTGKVHVTGVDLNTQQVKHTYSTNAGATFSTPVVAATGSNSNGFSKVRPRENAAPNLAVDGANNLHLVYSTYPTSGPAIAYYVRSTNSGGTWSTPLNLNTLFGNKETFMPVVCASGNSVAISTTVIDNNDSARYYEVSSTDNGQTWTTPLLLSGVAAYYPGAAGFYGDYNRNVRSQCRVYTGWCDGRGGLGPKVYFAKTNYCSTTSVPELTNVNSPVQLQSLYPVPTRSTLRMQFSNAAGTCLLQLSLTDMSGRAIVSSEQQLGSGSGELTLPLGVLQSGYYMLTVKASGAVIATRQVLVQ
jgi:hypothetical protein